MQELLQENERLRDIMLKCEQEILELKKVGEDHQAEIDSLLKFNQRLLAIIENQMPNKVLSRTSSGSNLQPIDEDNQKQIDPTSPTYQPVANRNFLPHKSSDGFYSENQERSNQEADSNNMKYLSEQNSDAFSNTQGFSSFDNNSPQLENHKKFSQDEFSQNEYPQGTIFRQEKQSLISIPKLFKLEKGLNDHYTKELFQSIEESKVPNNNPTKSNRSPLNDPMTNRISEAVTERFNLNEEQLSEELEEIQKMIKQYRQDFNSQEYEHICGIIKSDLENDLEEISQINNETMEFYENKVNELYYMKKKASNDLDASAVIMGIINRLNIPEKTERMIMNRIFRYSNQ